MKTTTQHFGTSQKIIALAILGVFGSANAADDMAQYTKPDSSITVGVTGANGNAKDRSISTQYNGMRDHNGYLQLDVDYLKRDDASGTWTSVQGRNLGTDNRDLGVAVQKQGTWKVTGDYSELVRRDIRTINTADTGVGSTTPTVVRLATPGTGSDVTLQLKRIGLGLGLEAWLTPGLQFEASFKNEDKDGARFWGKGYDCAGYVCGANTNLTAAASTAYQAANVKTAILMMAEPVNSNTKQFEMKLNFHDEKLNLSAGYYGSFYNNSNGNVQPTVPNALNGGLGTANPLYPITPNNAAAAGGGMSLQNVLQLPVALPPNNAAHQFSLSGNYALTPSTKATFKYAYTHATQNQDFGNQGLAAGAPRSSLDGVVDSTLAQFGITAKPIPKLSLLANVRYERKEDKTPNALYNVEAATTTAGVAQVLASAGPPVVKAVAGVTAVYSNVGAFWNNNHVSNTKVAGKLEASYQLPEDFRATLGLDYNSTERLTPESLVEEKVAGLSALREKNYETGYRMELRRTMSETLTGALGYSWSKRKGSDWTSLSTTVSALCGGISCYAQQVSDSTQQTVSATSVFPMTMADLERDKWKLSANWTPLEKLSLQFSLEDGKDRNKSATNAFSGKGYRGTDVSFYNIDAAYALTDNWKLSGYYSFGDQTQMINHSTGYTASLNNQNDAFGLGLVGKVSGRLEVGANLSYLNDVNKYGIGASPDAVGAAASATNQAQAAIGLPDVTFRQTTLSLFGKYALDKSADIRVSLVHQRSMLKEWTWGNNGVPFTYGDNTTVSLKEQQNVTFLGAAYIYKFQ